MAEPPSDRRNILGSIWDSDPEQRGGFPFGAVIALLTIVLTIMAIFLSTQGESRTGDDIRWSLFIILVTILCAIVIRLVYPRRAWYEGQHYFIDTKDIEFKTGLNKDYVGKALDGNIFGQVALLLDLKEAYSNKVLVRRHLTVADLRSAIEKNTIGQMAKDVDLTWMLEATTRDMEDVLMDESNGISANFYEWFSDMLKKVEEWH
jgi:hypothetical protein